MKAFALSATILAMLAGYSSAADFVNTPPPPAAPLYTDDGPYDWSGAYIGANVGYGWGKSDFRDAEYNGGHSIFPIFNWDVASRGLVYGMQAGYNVQRGSFVYGVEGELGYLNLKGSRLQPGLDPNGDPYDGTGTVNGGAFGSVNLRLGHAVDRTLFFAKAGFVYSDAKIGFSDNCATLSCGLGLIDASDKLGFGYQVGAGVEHALTEKWTVKAEYSFLDFGNANPRGIVGGGGGFFGQTKGVEGDLSAHTVRVGLNYKF